MSKTHDTIENVVGRGCYRQKSGYRFENIWVMYVYIMMRASQVRVSAAKTIRRLNGVRPRHCFRESSEWHTPCINSVCSEVDLQRRNHTSVPIYYVPIMCIKNVSYILRRYYAGRRFSARNEILYARNHNTSLTHYIHTRIISTRMLYIYQLRRPTAKCTMKIVQKVLSRRPETNESNIRL